MEITTRVSVTLTEGLVEQMDMYLSSGRAKVARKSDLVQLAVTEFLARNESLVENLPDDLQRKLAREESSLDLITHLLAAHYDKGVY